MPRCMAGCRGGRDGGVVPGDMGCGAGGRSLVVPRGTPPGVRVPESRLWPFAALSEPDFP